MRKFALVLGKDLLLEARQRDLWLVMLGFAVLEIFLAAFSVGGQLHQVAPGILWMAFLYAGMLSVGHGFAREMDDNTLGGLALAPGGRWPVLWAKLTAAFLALMGMQMLVAPLFLAVFGLGLGRMSASFVGVLALASWGVATVGTMMAIMGIHLQGRDAAMPVLLIPLLVPIVIMAVKATSLTWQHRPAIFWIRGLAAVDVVFMALPLLAFEYLWEG
ncbi:heme exporter protein CcmB [Sulfobacillus harzensis]|uniref:Cytochrome C biogenesis protein CcmB n=1 Tax=Sulfobacillus harzensis TaxID=2729629 RepID=A0A7Y0L5A0_9FIRM|nr:heme exporter protein CcmB [Sulfobacillus harzensis]NMP23579.1 cytochrome C biogenesis protein CcmB [Sulfobacillus harzensis]